MNDVIRVGKVSSINGTLVRVTYPDRGNAVTEELPLFSNGVYRPPLVGETVVAIHLSNGTTGGICLGGIALSGADYPLATLYQRLANIEDRLTALEVKVATLESTVAEAQQTIQDHTGELQSLDERVRALGG